MLHANGINKLFNLKNDYVKAKRNLKQCLKIEPGEATAMKYISYIQRKEKESVLERSSSGEIPNMKKLSTMTFNFKTIIPPENTEKLLAKKRANK